MLVLNARLYGGIQNFPFIHSGLSFQPTDIIFFLFELFVFTIFIIIIIVVITYCYRSQGGQTGFYQQTGSGNYGIQFGQPNQNHNSAGIQSFGSQVMCLFTLERSSFVLVGMP